MRPEIGNALRLQHRPMFANIPTADPVAALDLNLSVEDGWYTLLDVLCTDLQYETDNEDAPQIRVRRSRRLLDGSASGSTTPLTDSAR